MSFLAALALLVGALVIGPIVAHLLRRGELREHAFPPTALVPPARPAPRRRRWLEDRLLFVVRALMVLTLAILGATPLVRCSRLGLSRQSGASVAFALVVDDSQSMRAVSNGASRFDRALNGARDLLRSARAGDAVAIVLAGKPVRLALAATSDLSAARRALDQLHPSDRGTDLAGALTLAQSVLAGTEQADQRVVVLSDLAAELPANLVRGRLWHPLPELAEPVLNCGCVSAERRGRRVLVSVACNAQAATQNRRLRIFQEVKGAKTQVGEVALASASGQQTLSIDLDTAATELVAELSGSDQLAEDDSAPVAPSVHEILIGVYGNLEQSPVKTGGPPVLEQALAALESEIGVRPLSSLPTDAEEITPYAALLLDDPLGLGPEAQSAINTWVERGGVAAALLGPRSRYAQLGTTLEPFVRGAIVWEPSDVPGFNVETLSWLGPEAQSFGNLALRGRARVDLGSTFGAKVLGRFSDGKPWLLERRLGRGLAYISALPTSLEESDFALRPGFLALLDHWVAEARQRRGGRRGLPGAEWRFPERAQVTAIGPGGPLPVQEVPSQEGREAERMVVPELSGRYTTTVDGEAEARFVVLDPKELLTAPQRINPERWSAVPGEEPQRLDVSSESAAVLLGLFALELLVRLLRRNAAATPALRRVGPNPRA